MPIPRLERSCFTRGAWAGWAVANRAAEGLPREAVRQGEMGRCRGAMAGWSGLFVGDRLRLQGLVGQPRRGHDPTLVGAVSADECGVEYADPGAALRTEVERVVVEVIEPGIFGLEEAAGDADLAFRGHGG